MTTQVRTSSRPGLSPYIRLSFDRVRERHVLLGPESVLVLNVTGAAILELCDGKRTVTEIVRELNETYHEEVDDEVLTFLNRLAAKGYLRFADA